MILEGKGSHWLWSTWGQSCYAFHYNNFFYPLVDVSVKAKLTLYKISLRSNRCNYEYGNCSSACSESCFIYISTEALYISNQGSRDIELQVTMAAIVQCEQSAFSVLQQVIFCLSEDESCSNEGEEVHAYRGPRVIAPGKVAAFEQSCRHL